MVLFLRIIIAVLTGNIPEGKTPQEWYVLAYEEIKIWHYLVVLPWSLILITSNAIGSSTITWTLTFLGVGVILVGYLTLWHDRCLLGKNPTLNLQVKNHFYTLIKWTSPVCLAAKACALAARVGARLAPKEKLTNRRSG